VHPAGRATIDAWLAKMHDAADQDDAATVARLVRCIKNKIELEIKWQRQDAKNVSWRLTFPTKET
jgi:hypothetical protein